MKNNGETPRVKWREMAKLENKKPGASSGEVGVLEGESNSGGM